MLYQTSRDTLPESTLKEWRHPGPVHAQCNPAELAAQTLSRGQGALTDTGALSVRTGVFTGRSPKDRYLVLDDLSRDIVDWNSINQSLSPSRFELLLNKMLRYLEGREIWVRDGFSCTHPDFRMPIRFLTETPWANLFCHHMFLRPSPNGEDRIPYEWSLIHAPGFQADPKRDGTRNPHFVILNFSRNMILIGGTAYTGEIKKAVFSVLNFLLPEREQVLSMHCSANRGADGETALFFGLSGTGKTTLSAGGGRELIGDDEHGWAEDGIFNLEGGCYAKCFGLEESREPEIFRAIRPWALLENTPFFPGTCRVNFQDDQITENTRVSYPLDYITRNTEPGIAPHPKHIFFLSCDALGILPPLSRMDGRQALFQFLSGYTAKMSGTENGVSSPKAVFSSCFAAPFLPLNPIRFAGMLEERILRHGVSCWLVNTGWTSGSVGTGKRIPLQLTRNLVRAVLNGSLETGSWDLEPVFGYQVPLACPGVPAELLSPRSTWKDPDAYDLQARELKEAFREHARNFPGLDLGIYS